MNHLYQKFTTQLGRYNTPLYYYRYQNGFKSGPVVIRCRSSLSAFVTTNIGSDSNKNNVELSSPFAQNKRLRQRQPYNIYDSNLGYHLSHITRSISINLIRDYTRRLNPTLIHWIKKNIPKGFEDFFPDGMSEKEKNDEGTSTTTSRTSSSDKDTTDRGVSSKDNNDNKDDNKNKKDDKKKDKKKKSSTPLGDEDSGNLPGLIALLLLVVALRSLFDQQEEFSGNGDEITFTEFRNQFLLKGVVEKIIVINNKMAQVILKPEYVESVSSSASSLGSGSSMNSVATFQGMINGTGNGRNNRDNSMMDQNQHDEAMTTSWPNNSDSSTERKGGRSNNNKQPRPIYFYIGSVENLEEKLTKAQASFHPESW